MDIGNHYRQMATVKRIANIGNSNRRDGKTPGVGDEQPVVFMTCGNGQDNRSA